MSDLEALALLYLHHQDLAGLSPEQVLDRYQDTLQKMTEKKNINLAETKAKRREEQGPYIPTYKR